MWSDDGKKIQYKAYDATWHVFMVDKTVEIKGLLPEQESMIGLIFI
jgi:hypothetical protein